MNSNDGQNVSMIVRYFCVICSLVSEYCFKIYAEQFKLILQGEPENPVDGDIDFKCFFMKEIAKENRIKYGV